MLSFAPEFCEVDNSTTEKLKINFNISYVSEVKPHLNTDTEVAIESVCINRESVFSGNKTTQRKCKGFLSPGTKQTVRNNEVSVLLSRCP